MSLLSDDELRELPVFDDIDEALKNPKRVIRFRVDRIEDANTAARIAELRKLQELSISLSDVSALLPRLDELGDLQILHLQACKIQEFPERILRLANLRSLTIGNNGLTTVPEGIGGLAKLEHLRLAQNRLSRLPESIGRLENLTLLVLGMNILETLPDSLGNLRKLERVYLGGNRLEELPEGIENLVNVESLDLGFNNLRQLPPAVCQLRKLSSIRLMGNPLESLPACLSKLGEQGAVEIEVEKRSMFMDWTYRHSAASPKVDANELRLFVGSDSDLYPGLMDELSEAGLVEAAPAVLRVAREAIEVRTTVPEDYSIPGCSRFGGFPDLLSASQFPKTDGLYWSFLAQFNLAEVGPYNSFLPRSGLLSFFVDSTMSMECRVLFQKADVRELVTVRHVGPEAMFDDEDDYTSRPHRVEFRRYVSLPNSPPRDLREETRDTYEKWRIDRGGVDHHLNGYTYTQNESPQQLAAKKLRGLPGEWIPLLQLGWDGKVGFCFWDAGTLTFTIHQEDLRRWDFSNVQVSLESS